MIPPRTWQAQAGYSIANFMFTVAVSSAVLLFFWSTTSPDQVEGDGRHKDQDAIDQRDFRELAKRYGMTVEEYLADEKRQPWGGNPSHHQGQAGWTEGDGLFGRPITPTYAPHLLGVARFRKLRGAVTNPRARKDRNLWPLNTDYDLYSLGKDGKTSTLLSADESQDDIIRANNGQYFGLARDY